MSRASADADRSIDIAAGLLGSRVRHGAPLGALTTYRVGGCASLMMAIESRDDLSVLADAVRQSQISFLVVGRGSNMIVADTGYRGLAVSLGGDFAAISRTTDETGDQVLLEAGGGVALPVLARRCAGEGLRGLEWAVGVPGSVGGAVAMNAGGHGSEIADVATKVHLFDVYKGEDEEVPVDDLDLGYRSSNLSGSAVVLNATFRLQRGDAALAISEVDEIVRWRRANQPGGQNAGSVFTNPPGDSAGRLIELSGCKGLRVGTAQVSTKHANFIQADPGGSADDVIRLIALVRRKVADACGVQLVPEVRMIGFDVDCLAQITEA